MKNIKVFRVGMDLAESGEALGEKCYVEVVMKWNIRLQCLFIKLKFYSQDPER